eukprot:gene12939-17347_t
MDEIFEKPSYVPSGVLSIAPMIQWTDRYWRFLMRQITQHTLIYTEMTMDNALIYNPTNLEDFIGHDSVEHPLALQLGGNNPEMLAEAAALCESYSNNNFYEINLNCGCPSNRAKKVGFGAELMLDHDLLRQILKSIKRRIQTNLTVKCRIGVIPDKDSYHELIEFMNVLYECDIKHVIIHARKVVLRGLSPAQNRTIPPLFHDTVHHLAALFPDMTFTINGGLKSLEEAQFHRLNKGSPENDFGFDDFNRSLITDCPSAPVFGAMIGREAYRNPFMFRHADKLFYHDNTLHCVSRRQVLNNYIDYAMHAQDQNWHGSGTCNVIKPLHNFFTGCRTNVLYKQKLDELLKSVTSQKINKNNTNGFIIRKDIPFDELIWKAIEDTIPNSFLDEDLTV